MQEKVEYSIVIPVYNSISSLKPLSERINRVFREEIKASCEIIFVDDASTNPETWPVLMDLCERDSNTKAVRLMRNFGQIPAMVCGICQASGEFVITMDDDLQHQPEDIPKLIARQDHDIVVAGFDKLRHGPLRRLTHRAKGWLDHTLMGKPRGIQMSSFILMNGKIVEGIRNLVNPYPLFSFLLFSQTQDVVNVTVSHQQREEGKSGYTHYKRFHLFTNLIINHSPVLLSTVGLIGCFVFAGSSVWLIVALLRKWIWGIRITEMTLILSVFLAVSGLLFFSLGVIGKYLFRILQTVVKRPPYRIREIVEQNRTVF